MDSKSFDEKRNELESALSQFCEKLNLKGSLLKLESKSVLESLERGLKKTKERVQESVEGNLSSAQANVDHVRVQSHLGFMEAKQEWDEYKPHIEQAIADSGVEGQFDEAKLYAHLAKMDVADRFSNLRSEWEDSYEEKVLPGLSRAMNTMKDEVLRLSTALGKK